MRGAEHTNSGEQPTAAGSTPTEELRPDGQKKDHWILPDSERAKGYVRPVRTKYIHTVCGVVTSMPLKIAETYAADPYFYGSTFCCGCGTYYPVGADGDFVWDDASGSKVGT